MLRCCFGRQEEPKLVSIMVVNHLPELVLVQSDTFKYCPICMDDHQHVTKFKCSLCKQCICEGCAKSIIGIHGTKSMCSLCRVEPMCKNNESEIIRAHNNELIRTLIRNTSMKQNR